MKLTSAAMMQAPSHTSAQESKITRLCRNWMGCEGRPANAPAVLLETVLAAFQAGDDKQVGALLSLAAEDLRLLGEITRIVLDWLRNTGTLQSNPRLALEMMNMRRLYREAVEERETEPVPGRMIDSSSTDDVTRGIGQLAGSVLADMAKQLRGAWLMERQCVSLPRWRHWDVMLEVRPSVLLGETDVPERVAALMEEARNRLERFWLAEGTIAVHAYPVHASRALLGYMREHGLVIMGAGLADASPTALRPSLADKANDAFPLVTDARVHPPKLRGSLTDDADTPGEDVADAGAHSKNLFCSGKEGDDGNKGNSEGWYALLRHRLPLPDADSFREGRRHVLLIGLSLLPAFIAWHLLLPDPTRSRIAAFEENHARLVAARPWRQKEGADALDPLKTLEAYRGALRDFDATPSLPIYTEKTRQFLLGRFRSKFSMEKEWRELFDCTDPRISFRSETAVVQFRENILACAPFFFRKEGGRWRLDMKARTTLITEGANGTWQWRAGTPPESWRFAFSPQLEGEYEPGP